MPSDDHTTFSAIQKTSRCPLSIPSPRSWSREASVTSPDSIREIASPTVFTHVQPSGTGRRSSSHSLFDRSFASMPGLYRRFVEPPVRSALRGGFPPNAEGRSERRRLPLRTNTDTSSSRPPASRPRCAPRQRYGQCSAGGGSACMLVIFGPRSSLVHRKAPAPAVPSWLSRTAVSRCIRGPACP
jgi:hypothetical protein